MYMASSPAAKSATTFQSPLRGHDTHEAGHSRRVSSCRAILPGTLFSNVDFRTARCNLDLHDFPFPLDTEIAEVVLVIDEMDFVTRKVEEGVEGGGFVGE